MNYRVMEQTLCCMPTASCMADIDGSWKKEIEENFQKRRQGKRK